MLKKNNSYQKIIISSIILLAIISITIGFAAIQTTLQINGTASMQGATWNIKFDNLSSATVVGDASILTSPILSDTSIDSYNVLITKPGDSITYTFDVVNSGVLDAKIGTFTKASSLICESVNENPIEAEEDETLVCSSLIYTLTYTEDGSSVAQDDKLEAGETKSMTLTLGYNGIGYPIDEVNITGLDITMIYIQNN